MTFSIVFKVLYKKKMSKKKTSDFAFDMDRKENFVAHLTTTQQVYRSARAAAAEWGLSFSTLHNYLTRSTEASLTAMQNIAYKEHISLDWLVFASICSKKKSGLSYRDSGC